MNRKSKILWPLLALAWTALVMAPAWWTMAKAERILSLAGLAGKIPQDCSRQILGAHVFILIMGLTGLAATYIAHNRGLAKRSGIQKGLAASEERFRGIFENASVGIAQIAPDGRLMSFNQPFEKLAGRSLRELKACKIGELLIRGHQKPYRELTLLTLEGKNNSFDLEVRFAAGNRAPVWGNLSQSLIRKADGAPDYFVLVAQNITDRKQAERKLFESEERFRVAFETCPDSVNINRLSDGMYVSINQGFTNILALPNRTWPERPPWN